MSQLSTFYPENVTAIKGSTGTLADNAVLRADGVGGSTAQPSDLIIDDAATSPQNNVAIRNNHSQANSALVLCNKGTGGFIVSPARPDGTATGGGNARAAESVCIVPERSAATQVASGARSVNIGRRSTASAADSVAIGSTATSSGTNAVSIGVTSQATSLNTVAIGNLCQSLAEAGVTLGNDARVVSGAFYGLAIGQAVRANNEECISIGGVNNTATGNNSIVVGSRSSTNAVNAAVVGYNIASSTRSEFATRPFRSVYWGGTTTDATANVELFLDATSANRLTLATNTALVADILIIGNSTASSKSYWASRRVAIRRDAGNVALIGAVEGTESGSTASTPWSFTIDADTTNQALRIRVTGEASTSITWRATAFYRLV